MPRCVERIIANVKKAYLIEWPLPGPVQILIMDGWKQGSGTEGSEIAVAIM